MIYNVHVGVVDLIDAESPDEAINILCKRLRQFGFDPYEEGQDAFLSEEQE